MENCTVVAEAPTFAVPLFRACLLRAHTVKTLFIALFTMTDADAVGESPGRAKVLFDYCWLVQ